MRVGVVLEEILRVVLDDEHLVISDEMTAKDHPRWDSVAQINLMFSVEQAFGVYFVGNQFNQFQNVGELRAYLERKCQQQN